MCMYMYMHSGNCYCTMLLEPECPLESVLYLESVYSKPECMYWFLLANTCILLRHVSMDFYNCYSGDL